MKRSTARIGPALAAALALLQPGCRQSFETNEQVEGIVKLDGQPLANAVVQFVPDVNAKVQAPPSMAMTDEKGRYTLACENRKSGAIVGKHNVVVTLGRAAPGADREERPRADAPGRVDVPNVYAIAAKTPLQIEVTRDQHTYDLSLSSSARPR